MFKYEKFPQTFITRRHGDKSSGSRDDFVGKTDITICHHKYRVRTLFGNKYGEYQHSQQRNRLGSPAGPFTALVILSAQKITSTSMRSYVKSNDIQS